MNNLRKFAVLLLAAEFGLSLVPAWGQENSRSVDFNRDVLPILSENCFACHGFDDAARQGGLRLDDARAALSEADSGRLAIVPGKPERSELLRRIAAEDPSERMPPPEVEKRLSPEQQNTLRRWIAAGAEYQRHWSFVPPKRVVPPQPAQVEHPIDRFVRARLDSVGLTPAPEADDATLLRRLSLDLTGLPPSIEELDNYLSAAKEDRNAAYLAAVDRLLESPHYGERWARWWLDQARYADSNGYSIDAPRTIWKYRDWVIGALNDDLPFDQFTVEQLAGDLLPDPSTSQRIATGFHRNTQINQEGGIDKEQFRIDSVFDRVATTGTVWLGLTIGCAQCHDHKFDPISQVEYYRMFAFFNNQDEPALKVSGRRNEDPELLAKLSAAEQKLDDFIASEFEKYLAWETRLTAEQIAKLSPEQQQALAIEPSERSAEQTRLLFAIEVGKISNEFQKLQQAFEDLRGQVMGETTTLVLREREQPRTTTVFIKGDFTRPAEEVSPGTPSMLPPLPDTEQAQPSRLDLARWIISRENPLTARVIVNRVWQVYFGRGLVETENDFGSLGSPPSHPELLDWLAVEFQELDWSLKGLHRLIVTSRTYRQSSVARDDVRRLDPHNYLLARQQRLRLEAELVRDTCLVAAGLLVPEMGGPPVFPPIPDGVMNQGQVNRKWNTSTGSPRYRRGIYTFVYRATPPPSLNVFDAPDGYSTCTRRTRSNTPLQALTLLNDTGFFEFASALAKVIDRDGIVTAFRRCTARHPDQAEVDLLSNLDSLSAARVMLNLDETITRE